jgi:hypothetical protein
MATDTQAQRLSEKSTAKDLNRFVRGDVLHSASNF